MHIVNYLMQLLLEVCKNNWFPMQ